MAFRKFTDRDGLEWEVRIRSRTEWDLEPVGNNRERARTAPAPGRMRCCWNLAPTSGFPSDRAASSRTDRLHGARD